MSDAQLMELVRRGEARAFRLLVEAHWDRLVAYAQSMTGDRDSAQDAVQETFTRLWQARAEWQATGPYEGTCTGPCATASSTGDAG